MELQLELALSTNSSKNQDCDTKRKRNFDQAFVGVHKNVDVPPTLQLFKMNGEMYEQEQKLAFSNRNFADVTDDFVVGWPPVKSWRKQFCHHSRRGCATNYVNVENSGGGGGGGRVSNSMYVKVKMEGFGITRKIDLRIHTAYHTLAAKLVSLFGICEENVEEYKLIYQNKEGDWLHARDVPWQTFINSVQRLKLEKNGY